MFSKCQKDSNETEIQGIGLIGLALRFRVGLFDYNGVEPGLGPGLFTPVSTRQGSEITLRAVGEVVIDIMPLLPLSVDSTEVR